MSYVIVNRDGEFYVGYLIDHAVWFRRCREDCKFDEATADKILSQLLAMGYIDIEKKIYAPPSRKKKTPKPE